MAEAAAPASGLNCNPAASAAFFATGSVNVYPGPVLEGYIKLQVIREQAAEDRRMEDFKMRI